MARDFAKSKLSEHAASAGHGSDNGNADPVMAQALENVRAGSNGPSSLANATGQGIPVQDLKDFIMKYNAPVNQTGDVYHNISEEYGDVVADAWQCGDLPGVMTKVIQQASEPAYSTGDVAFDDQLVGDVFAEQDNADTPPEIGGLFKRARAKHKLKKAARIQKRALRRKAKDDALNAADQTLDAAKNMEGSNVTDSMTQQQQYYAAQQPPSYAPSGSVMPADIGASQGLTPGGAGYFESFPDYGMSMNVDPMAGINQPDPNMAGWPIM
jgi:hypothetical protein